MRWGTVLFYDRWAKDLQLPHNLKQSNLKYKFQSWFNKLYDDLVYPEKRFWVKVSNIDIRLVLMTLSQCTQYRPRNKGLPSNSMAKQQGNFCSESILSNSWPHAFGLGAALMTWKSRYHQIIENNSVLISSIIEQT